MTPASKPAAASAAVDAEEVLQLLQSIVADVLGEAVDPTQPLMEVCLPCSGDFLLPVQHDTCSTLNCRVPSLGPANSAVVAHPRLQGSRLLTAPVHGARKDLAGGGDSCNVVARLAATCHPSLHPHD